MYVTTSFHRHIMAERPDIRSSVHVPMVYEDVEPKTQAWEYHLLTVDAREVALPEAEQLNELGKDGWILAGIVDERATGKGAKVYYYFMRQKAA